jgi:hypothetical protein
MDTAEMAKHLRVYTGGYPYLVSRICQLLDEQVSHELGAAATWSGASILTSIRSRA